MDENGGAILAIALVSDDGALVAGALVEHRVELGGLWFAEVERLDFALVLVSRFGGREIEVVIELVPVDNPSFIWDWLIAPPR